MAQHRRALLVGEKSPLHSRSGSERKRLIETVSLDNGSVPPRKCLPGVLQTPKNRWEEEGAGNTPRVLHERQPE